LVRQLNDEQYISVARVLVTASLVVLELGVDLVTDLKTLGLLELYGDFQELGGISSTVEKDFESSENHVGALDVFVE